MNKETEKKKKYTYDQRILTTLVEKYALTAVYIRQCLSGHNLSITADKIKADYKDLETKFSQVTEAFLNKI